MAKKYVYLFHEGNKDMKEVLGGKGANLAEMTNIGLPVPPGVTITTEGCKDYFEQGRQLPAELLEQLWSQIAKVEEQTGKTFGDQENPLLVSVRSGAVVSMPGMMDTVLNLGLNDITVSGVIKKSGNERFALDCYRRFIQMYSDVVMEIEHYLFDNILEDVRHAEGVQHDHEISIDGLKKIIDGYKKLVKKESGKDFPQEPKDQLLLAVQAVFNSWDNPRADVYRQIHKIPAHLGTAVNVQSMVFGNMGDESGTGVAFTRNPSTGEKVLYGEYLINAQGEDVVAGIRTPQPITRLQEDLPEAYQQFLDVAKLLEDHYQDMQDIEFTIEDRKLYMLQTRNGKRTTTAAINIAVDMVAEGLITKEQGILRIDPMQLDQLLHPSIDPTAELAVLATGLPASPGAACGAIVFDADDAEKLGKEGKAVLLVRNETTPDDIHGIVVAQGILTARGGMTSHAAVVARGMGKPCVCGCDEIKIDYHAETVTIGEVTFAKGDTVSLDGSTGRIINGVVPLIPPSIGEKFQQLLAWADEVGGMEVRANADNPEDAQKAREFGATGIGLCRTEHMFMAQDRLPVVQDMILAENIEDRVIALDKLLPMQKEDFYGILKAMVGLPTTIRLLDPPLHEFLPNGEELALEINNLKHEGAAESVIAEKESLLRKVRGLHECNPMLGHRGCRLGVSYPEIYKMQARAIFMAAAQLTKEGFEVLPEIEIPLVIDVAELKMLREAIEFIGAEVQEAEMVKIHYTVGTMLELPRACLMADELAQHADYFTFGTNDLTQTTLGFSRDDAEGKFMQHYLDKKILEDNPFVVLDRKGVGKLIEIAVNSGRQVKEDMVIGICGEHGGEPSSIEFCHNTGLSFVSCSPYRVPIARVAKAQAQIKNPRV